MMILFIALILFFSQDTYGQKAPSYPYYYPFSDIIYEHEIPMPDVQYDLPQELIGEFIIVTPFSNIEITIFPNNKYIVHINQPHHVDYYSYGYIINENNTWYFSPALSYRKYFHITTEINILNSFFSFSYRQLGGTGILRAIKKENILLESITESITVSGEFASRQYFCFNNLDTDEIEFNEIVISPDDFSWSHFLRIDHGIVMITLVTFFENDRQEGHIVYEGVLEITDENNGIKRGIVRFTNGVPYFYIENGIAEIEINNNNIKITMLYSPSQRVLADREIPDNWHFPARLVLEF